MKALTILLNERQIHLDIFKQNEELGDPKKDSYIIRLNEAIEELQDLKDLDKKSCNDCYYLKNISDNKYKCTNDNSYVDDIFTGYANHHLTFRCRFFSKKMESKDA